MSEPSDKIAGEAAHPSVRLAAERLPAVPVLAVALALVAIVVLLSLVTRGILAVRERSLRPDRDFPERTLGAPSTVASIREEPFALPRTPVRLHDAKAALLDGYGVVDRARGVVRIPVEAAMDIVARRAQGGAR